MGSSCKFGGRARNRTSKSRRSAPRSSGTSGRRCLHMLLVALGMLNWMPRACCSRCLSKYCKPFSLSREYLKVRYTQASGRAGPPKDVTHSDPWYGDMNRCKHQKAMCNTHRVTSENDKICVLAQRASSPLQAPRAHPSKSMHKSTKAKEHKETHASSNSTTLKSTRTSRQLLT